VLGILAVAGHDTRVPSPAALLLLGVTAGSAEQSRAELTAARIRIADELAPPQTADPLGTGEVPNGSQSGTPPSNVTARAAVQDLLFSPCAAISDLQLSVNLFMSRPDLTQSFIS
jgi:hypothetical protein